MPEPMNELEGVCKSVKKPWLSATPSSCFSLFAREEQESLDREECLKRRQDVAELDVINLCFR
jgi:hypothetical protein